MQSASEREYLQGPLSRFQISLGRCEGFSFGVLEICGLGVRDAGVEELRVILDLRYGRDGFWA